MVVTELASKNGDLKKIPKIQLQVTQMFLNWNQIRVSLEQWKVVLQPEPASASLLNYHGMFEYKKEEVESDTMQ